MDEGAGVINERVRNYFDLDEFGSSTCQVTDIMIFLIKSKKSLQNVPFLGEQ